MIYNQDCMEAMKEMSDNQFDLAIVDPPYGIQINSAGWIKAKKQKKIHKQANWDDKPPTKEFFTELFRVSKNQIIWGGNYFDLPPTRCFLIWDKVVRMDQADCELAWTSFSKSARIFRYAKGNESGFAPKSTDIDKQFANIHPTQKPVKLYEWLLMNYAKEGDTILDTHLGSGSITIACENLGFELTGYEIDKEYFEAAKKRIEQHKQQGRLW